METMMPSPSGNPVRLTDSEFEALRNVVEGGPLKQTIRDADRTRLIELGFITEGLGGLVPTDAGRARLAQGR
jgi:hypothetical protein